MPVATLDWNGIVLALIAAVPASIAATVSLMNRRWLRTPSGGTIGRTAETALDLAAVDVGTTQAVLAHVTGDKIEAERIVEQLAEKLKARTEQIEKRG